MIRSPYRVVLADPAWPYDDKGQSGSGKNSGAAVHYKTMPLPAIRALLPPTSPLVAEDALCFCWSTGPFGDDAVDVIEAWGFEHVTSTGFVWVKTGTPWATMAAIEEALVSQGIAPAAARMALQSVGARLMPAWPIGQGSYTRANPELVIIGKRGRGVPRVDAGVQSLVLAPRGRHSQKPREVHCRIERLCGDVPRLELFARERMPGWDAYGDEPGVEYDLEIGPDGALRVRAEAA